MPKYQAGLFLAVLAVFGTVWGLALASNHGHHPSFGPMGWTNAGGPSVSIGFAARIIQLEFRRLIAVAGTVVTIR